MWESIFHVQLAFSSYYRFNQLFPVNWFNNLQRINIKVDLKTSMIINTCMVPQNTKLNRNRCCVRFKKQSLFDGTNRILQNIIFGCFVGLQTRYIKYITEIIFFYCGQIHHKGEILWIPKSLTLQKACRLSSRNMICGKNRKERKFYSPARYVAVT